MPDISPGENRAPRDEPAREKPGCRGRGVHADPLRGARRCAIIGASGRRVRGQSLVRGRGSDVRAHAGASSFHLATGTSRRVASSVGRGMSGRGAARRGDESRAHRDNELWCCKRCNLGEPRGFTDPRAVFHVAADAAKSAPTGNIPGLRVNAFMWSDGLEPGDASARLRGRGPRCRMRPRRRPAEMVLPLDPGLYHSPGRVTGSPNCCAEPGSVKPPRRPTSRTETPG